MTPLLSTDNAFVESENRLNKALSEFEKARQTFMRCRAFSNKALVDICSQHLFEVSEEHAKLKRALDKV